MKSTCSVCNAPIKGNSGICINCRKQQMMQFNVDFKHSVKVNQENKLYQQIDEFINQYKLSISTTQLDDFLTSSDFFRNSVDAMSYVKKHSVEFFDLCCKRLQLIIEGTSNPENLIRKLIIHRDMMEVICKNSSKVRKIMQSMLSDMNAELDRYLRKRSVADLIVKRQRRLIIESKFFFALFGLLIVFSTGYFVYM